jgi:hypothetical protein
MRNLRERKLLMATHGCEILEFCPVSEYEETEIPRYINSFIQSSTETFASAVIQFMSGYFWSGLRWSWRFSSKFLASSRQLSGNKLRLGHDLSFYSLI